MNFDEKIDELLKDRAESDRMRLKAVADFERASLEIEKFGAEVTAFDTVIAVYKEKSSSFTLTKVQADDAPPPFIEIDKSSAGNGSTKVDLRPNGVGFATNGKSSDNKKSFRQVGKDIFNDLPQIYTKNDVATLILTQFSEIETLNENTLRGIVTEYVEDGLAKIHEQSTGRTLQKYIKVS